MGSAETPNENGTHLRKKMVAAADAISCNIVFLVKQEKNNNVKLVCF
jgi:hypothetical protein